jgi:hypothetical protein
MLAPYKAAPDVSHITVGNKGAAEMVTPLVPDPLANFIGTRKEAAMRIRSTYFKVKDMPASVAFWKGFSSRNPRRSPLGARGASGLGDFRSMEGLGAAPREA